MKPAVLGGEPRFPEGLPLVRPTLPDTGPLARRLQAILDSGILTNGPTVRELEERVAQRTGAAHAVGVANCTAGLMLVYQALGIGPGRAVVMPSFTFAASAHAVRWAGGTCRFADVEPERATLDVDDAAAAIGDEPAAAISATHVYGNPCEVERIAALAEETGLPVVYDAAHALGSERAGTPIGRHGTAEVFSLSPTKVVVAGEGGIVTTDDEGLADILRLGRDYGNPGTYDCSFPGLNARLSELHAAVALHSLARLDANIERRSQLVARFSESVADVPGLRVVTPGTGDRSTFKDLTLVVDPEGFGVDAATLKAALQADGIDSRRYYHPPIHRQGAYRDTRRSLPVTDRLADQVLTPPLWSHLTTDQLDGVAEVIAAVHHHAEEVADALRAGGVPAGSIAEPMVEPGEA